MSSTPTPGESAATALPPARPHSPAPAPASAAGAPSTSELVVEVSQLRYALRARNTRSVAAADGELRSLLRRRDALLRELRRRGLDFSNEVPGEPNARVESEQTQAPQQQYSAAEQSTLVELAVKVENLLQALATRTVIGQAEGILIERHKLTTEAAFAMLAHASQVTNRKVRDIAADLVRTGELAGPR